jgi:hypothetical protein
VDERFETDLRAGYPDDAPGVVLGSPMLDGEVLAGVRVRLPLSTVNRHGLVAGATGTGKTKTLQLIAGQLSDAGVPVFVADVKGDLSRLAQPIDAADPKVAERAASLGRRTPFASGRTALADGPRWRSGPPDGRVVRARAAR